MHDFKKMSIENEQIKLKLPFAKSIVARKGLQNLDPEAGEGFNKLSRAAKSNRLSRSFEDNIERLWAMLLGRDGLSRAALRGMIGDFSKNIDIIDNLLNEAMGTLPRWFTKLPCLTLFCCFTFAIFIEIYLRQAALEEDTEEARISYLSSMLDKESDDVIAGFKKTCEETFKDFFMEGVSNFEQALPDRLHDMPDLSSKVCLSASVRFVVGIEEALPFVFHRNPPRMEKMVQGWKSECETVKRQKTVICKPRAVEEGVVYSDTPEIFFKAYGTLVPEGCIEFEGLRTGILLCKELARDSADLKNEVYGYHGYKSAKERYDVRVVRLQIELYNSWSCITKCAMGTAEEICDSEGIRAHLQQTSISLFWKSVQSKASLIKDNLQELFNSLWILCIIAEDEGDTFAKVCSHYLNF